MSSSEIGFQMGRCFSLTFYCLLTGIRSASLCFCWDPTTIEPWPNVDWKAWQLAWCNSFPINSLDSDLIVAILRGDSGHCFCHFPYVSFLFFYFYSSQLEVFLGICWCISNDLLSISIENLHKPTKLLMIFTDLQ